jgi:ENTS family enterobactin (siderophore) exporter
MSINRFLLDVSPLRDSKPFRYAYAARTTSVLVTGMLLVAASIQIYELTGSSIAVAFLNAFMAVPMVIALIIGGVLSDRMDRRQLMLWSRSVYVLSVVIFLVNALLPTAHVWPIYLAAAIGGAAGGISVPAMMAVTPALVGRDRLAAAAALSGLSMQIGGIIGPALAGVLIAGPGLVFCYAIVLVGVLITPFLLHQLPSLPPQGAPKHDSKVQSFVEGVAFLRKHPLLRTLLIIDLAAMVLATPIALLPQWSDQILGRGPEATGMLYAAPAIGAMITALTSGWTRTVARPGLIVAIAIMLWGVAIAMLALGSTLWWALISLAVMGAADTVSKILRMALVQHHTPDGLLGRVSSLWMMQGSIGPALGNLQIGITARFLSPPAALLLGGTACVLRAATFATASTHLRTAQLTMKAGKK